MSVNTWDRVNKRLIPLAGTQNQALAAIEDDIDDINNKIEKSSDQYNSTKAYKVGDYVIHDDTVYKCTTACTAGSWTVNQSCFTIDSLTNAVSELNSSLNGLIKFYEETKTPTNAGTAVLNIPSDATYILNAWSNDPNAYVVQYSKNSFGCFAYNHVAKTTSTTFYILYV